MTVPEVVHGASRSVALEPGWRVEGVPLISSHLVPPRQPSSSCSRPTVSSPTRCTSGPSLFGLPLALRSPLLHEACCNPRACLSARLEACAIVGGQTRSDGREEATSESASAGLACCLRLFSCARPNLFNHDAHPSPDCACPSSAKRGCFGLERAVGAVRGQQGRVVRASGCCARLSPLSLSPALRSGSRIVAFLSITTHPSTIVTAPLASMSAPSPPGAAQAAVSITSGSPSASASASSSRSWLAPLSAGSLLDAA